MLDWLLWVAGTALFTAVFAGVYYFGKSFLPAR